MPSKNQHDMNDMPPMQKEHAVSTENPNQSSFPALPNIWALHPGHFFLVTSLPLCFSAYGGWRKPMNVFIEDYLRAVTKGKITELENADPQIRKSVGSAVAARAFRVATFGSLGVFGLVASLVMYASGCQSFHEASQMLQEWSRQPKVYEALGVKDRLAEGYRETEGMTPDEELEYIAKTYFPGSNETENEMNVKDDRKL